MVLTEALDDCMPGEDLFGLAVDGAGMSPLLDEPRAGPTADHLDQHDRQRHGDQSDGSEQR